MSSSTALEQLLGHAAWLRRFARALVRDADDAEDIVQSTLVAAWDQPPPADVKPRPWLARVARNRAVDLGRSESRRGAREEKADVLAASLADPEQLIGELQIHRAVAEEVTALGEPYREVVFLRYYEGLNATEIAERLGVPTGTVRWRLKEGLERVRVQLDRRHGGNRQQWVAALMPLLPTVRGQSAARPSAAAPPSWFSKPVMSTGGWISAAVVVVVGVMAFIGIRVTASRSGGRDAKVTAIVSTEQGMHAAGAMSGLVLRPAPPKFSNQRNPLSDDDEAPPWIGPPEPLMRQMLTAIAAGSYDDFLLHADDTLKAVLRKPALEILTSEVGPHLARGYAVESWGALHRETATVYLYKIGFFDEGTDDLLVQMSMTGGRVNGFVLQ